MVDHRLPKIENYTSDNVDFHYSASVESCVDGSSLMPSNEITQNKIMAVNNNGISVKVKKEENIPTENTFELDDFLFTKPVDSTSNMWPKHKRILKYFVENPYDSPYITIENQIKVFGICTPKFLDTRPIRCALCGRRNKNRTMFRCIIISSTIVISSCFLCYKLVNSWVAYNNKAKYIWDHERSATNMEFIINLIKLRLDEKRKSPLLFDRNNELILNMAPISSNEEISQISLNKLDLLSSRRRMKKDQTVDAYLANCSKLKWNPVIVQSYFTINRKEEPKKRRRI